MKDDRKNSRHVAISAAAYSLLEEKGYAGASMLSIAKAAKASNETLYRWYGDKKGLFERLVRDNAAETEQILKTAIAREDDALQTLEKVAPVLLTVLLSDRAILLNRAAAAEPTGELGAAVSVGGRNVVQPLFGKILQPLALDNNLDAKQMTGLFLSLLIGDRQIKRVIGVEEAPSRSDIETQTAAALHSFSKLIA